jgi:hypothetical protein
MNWRRFWLVLTAGFYGFMLVRLFAVYVLGLK